MLWTIMPLEMVMEGYDTYEPAYTEIAWNNATLLVEQTDENSARVVRLISSNPQDYLKPELQPGTIIQLNCKGWAALC